MLKRKKEEAIFNTMHNKRISSDIKTKQNPCSNTKEKILIKNNSFYYYCNIINIILVLLVFALKCNVLSLSDNRLYISNFSNITLKIKGIGLSNIFSNTSNRKFNAVNFPKEVIINGEIQNTVNYSYYFNQTINIVELKWDNNNINCQNMFRECNNIIAIDFSYFDTSRVTSMAYMFFKSISLFYLNLSNFDTSQVLDMQYMFHTCKSLTSLNLSSFNTTQVKNMDDMFDDCSNLEYIIFFFN